MIILQLAGGKLILSREGAEQLLKEIQDNLHLQNNVNVNVLRDLKKRFSILDQEGCHFAAPFLLSSFHMIDMVYLSFIHISILCYLFNRIL